MGDNVQTSPDPWGASGALNLADPIENKLVGGSVSVPHYGVDYPPSTGNVIPFVELSPPLWTRMGGHSGTRWRGEFSAALRLEC